jgi:hypothetical protein
MGGLNMRLHMILNMPAVLSIHKIGKRERREREGVGEEGRKDAGVEIPQ